jgi:pimeloyl-ACP methyl ester carboxylesterase
LCRHLGNGVELVIIKDVGHIPQSEAPEAFNAAVLAFLKDGWLPQSRL